jgi:hypothetical protein
MQGKLFEAFQYESIAITMPRALYKEPIKEFQDTKPLMNKKWRHDGCKQWWNEVHNRRRKATSSYMRAFKGERITPTIDRELKLLR